MSTVTVSRAVPSTPTRRLRIAISVLCTATALVHLFLGVVTTLLVVGQPDLAATLGGTTMLSVMAALFYLSFAGYVGFNVALYRAAFHRYRRLARLALIAWAAGNVLAYVVVLRGQLDAFGVADKAAELLLIVLLVIEGRRVARQG
jgi:hypothetical protein